MIIEEIIHGESKKVEFKENLPERSEKYTKTVVAYANTQGGKIIFGVADETREIVGIDDSVLFQTMDKISNAISDSCEPQIIPEIEPYTIAGRNVIVVTVTPEQQRPYYLKAKGKMNGTYIRIGGTSRPASPDKIKELEMEGAKISWDELTCVGYQVTDKAVKKLCKDMNDRRKEIQKQKNIAEKLPTVTKTNLENWKILKKSGDEYLASNAFVLLTSDYFQFSKTQCAVFKGADRAVFLDKREYTGPLYEQIDEAVGFVLRNIRLGVTIKGILRREDYELPVEAIREMIVNAHCHRNYADESCVQVAVYDNRLEVTSPGGFYNGLTLEDAILGHTKQRNKVIANAFKQIGLVEAWGTGFQRIQSSSVEYGLPAPEFIEAYDFFRVNLYRKELPIGGSQSIGNSAENNQNSIGEASAEHRNNIGDSSANNYSNAIQELNSTQNKILELLASNPRMTGKKLAEEIGIAQRNVEENIKKLKNLKVLVRHGSNKDGYWEVRKLERR